MTSEFVPLQFEENPTDWLESHFPGISVRGVAQIDHCSFHVLLRGSDAAAVRKYLVQDLTPPFCRRKSDSLCSDFEPGLSFSYYNDHFTPGELERTAISYAALLPTLVYIADHKYVCGKIKELNPKLLKAML